LHGSADQEGGALAGGARTDLGLEIAIGAFDDRSDLAPQIQVNYPVRLPWVETIFDKPVHQDPDYYARQEQIISFQHPDHETADWPAQGFQL